MHCGVDLELLLLHVAGTIVIVVVSAYVVVVVVYC
jgi:hypothetical protein